MTDPDQPAQPSRRKKVLRTLAIVGALLVLVGALAATKTAQIASLIAFGEEAEKAGPPPETVGTHRVEQLDWQRVLRAVGSVVSEKGVTLTNEVGGVVRRLYFDSGQKVKKGQLLVELDTDVEQAQLNAIIAQRKLAEISAKRSKELVKLGAGTQSELDNNESTLQRLIADENALKAQIARKKIRAPFSGKLGLRRVNLGQYLSPGTSIAVLESTEALFVEFSLPQKDLQKVAIDTPVRVRPEEEHDTPKGAASQSQTEAPAASGTPSPVTAPSDTAAKPSAYDGTDWIAGKVSAIDPTVDATTRTFTARASLPEDELRPGMFLRVQVMLPAGDSTVIVPATAVVRAPYGDSVFVVEEAEGKEEPAKARQQFVQLGEARGDFIAIEGGVKPGQVVVSTGAFKLFNGASIVVNNKSQAKARLHPTVSNR